MSLINDALKQARKSPPEGVPSALTPLQPTAGRSSSAPVWLLPAIVVLLVVVAVSFIGWAATHRAAASQSATVAAAQPVATPRESTAVVTAPVAPPVAATPLPAAQPQLVNSPPPPIQPATPKLQGIDYSSSAPSAIVDGKTIRPGDQLHQYRVKAISRTAVTLIGPDRKELVLGMEN